MSSRRALLSVALALLVVAVAGRDASPPAQAAGPCGGSTVRITKVLWIWMENKSYSSVIGSASAPYENRLARQCGLATNYHGIGHPSLPNYLAATSGSTHAITTDCNPASCPVKGRSLMGQGPSRVYAQSMKSKCETDDAGRYAVRHNPWPYYVGERLACRAGDVPLGTPSLGPLRFDLAAGLKPFSLAVPNVCYDTHDCSVSTGDNWLKRWLPLIFARRDYSTGRLLVVLTWDENYGAGNHVPAILMAKRITPGKRSSTKFNHYSLLRTTEGLLGLPLLRNAARAASMRAAFGL